MQIENDINDILELLLSAGQMLLENGAETYRAENAVLYMFEAIGMGQITVVGLVTSISVNIYYEKKHYSGMRAIRNRNINLDKIERINEISRNVSGGVMTVGDAVLSLNEIKNDKKEKKVLSLCSSGFAAAAFAFLLGGGPFEALGAGLSCALAQFVPIFMKKTPSFGFFVSIAGGILPALAGAIFASFLTSCNMSTIALAGMLPHFPGVATVNAIRDAINGDLISGVTRGAEALLIAVGLSMGALIGFYVATLF